MSDPIDQLKQAVVKTLHKIGIMLVSDIRVNLNTAQPYTREGARFYGEDPSKPGEFPHKLSGQLIKGIAYTVDEAEMVLTVGTNVKHGRFLEFGTKHMQPRPWLLRTYEAAAGKIAALFGKIGGA